MAQANSSSTIISLFIFLGFISFGQGESARLGSKADFTYNRPDGTTETMTIELTTKDFVKRPWTAVWQAIQLANMDFQGSKWSLFDLHKQNEQNWSDADWSDAAVVSVRAEWQKSDLYIEISGSLEITTLTDPAKFESAEGPRLVKKIIEFIVLHPNDLPPDDVQVQVLTTGTINIGYTIIFQRRTKSEADVIADRVSLIRDFTTGYFKEVARHHLIGFDDEKKEYWSKIGIDDIDVAETKILPTMTINTVSMATINLQLGGNTVIDDTGAFAALIYIGSDWAHTKITILRQLGNGISQESHNIVYSTVSHGGAEHDGKTNLSDKDIIYVSATQKAATINLQLCGKTVIDGTGGFAAKVNIQRSWADTKKAILNQLGNSISRRSHNILYSTVSLGGDEHDDWTNLSDKDIIYVSAIQKVSSGSVISTDGRGSVRVAKEATKEGRSKLEIAMVILFSLGVIVVASIALWYWYRRKKHYERQEELELKRSQGTW